MRYSLFLCFLLFLFNCSSQSKLPDYLYQEGLALLLKEEYLEAIKKFDEVLLLDSVFVDAYLNRGYAKENLNDYVGAKADYMKAIHTSPNRAVVAYNNIAAMYAENERLDSALYYYKQAIVTDSLYAFSYNGLAHIHMLRLEHFEAINNFKKYRALSQNFCKRLEQEGLGQHCDQVRDIYDITAYYIGLAYKALGIQDSAILYLKQAVDSRVSGAIDSLKTIK